jgi:signal transduction histidine kinase
VRNAGGLVAALTELTRAAQAELRVTGHQEPEPDAARALWFVAAEALANASKHAPGSHVLVTLDRGETATLTVTDDGPGGANREGAGLRGLAERIVRLGGRLSIESSSSGTTISARLGRPSDVVPLIPVGAEAVTVEP